MIYDNRETLVIAAQKDACEIRIRRKNAQKYNQIFLGDKKNGHLIEKTVRGGRLLYVFDFFVQKGVGVVRF